MRKNKYEYNEGLINIEKGSAAKLWFTIIAILIIALIGATGYYVYKNRDNLEWSFKLPWQRDEDGTGGFGGSKENNGKGKDNTGSSAVLEEPKLTHETLVEDFNYGIYVENLEKINIGYNIDVIFESKGRPYKVALEKILVDGFDTTTSFTRNVGSEDRLSMTVRINQTELDAVNIKAFNELTFYIRVTDEDGKSTLKPYKVYVTKNFLNKNDLGDLSYIDEKNQTKVRFYKVTEDKENTYIFFDFKNSSVARNQIVTIKKLLINGKLYEYKSLKENVYQGAEKVIFLTIPKKDVKKIENFTIQFTLINEEEGQKTAAFITNEYSRTI